MYISDPVFDNAGITRSFAGGEARPLYQALGGLHGTHRASKSFPDPNNCWMPGSAGKPDLSMTIFIVEATLEIPATCTGSIIAKTALRDVPAGRPGGAVDYVSTTRFGVSDGTHTGGEERATRVSEAQGIVEFAKQVPWDANSCTATNDIFVYVKYLHSTGTFTFIEVGFYSRVESDKGVPVDKSPNPVIRLNPCNNLTPIRSPYVPGKESQRYRKLSASVRKQVNTDTDQVFREETSIRRKLYPTKSKDRPLLHHWLRIRDRVMREGGLGIGVGGLAIETGKCRRYNPDYHPEICRECVNICNSTYPLEPCEGSKFWCKAINADALRERQRCYRETCGWRCAVCI